MYVNILDHGVTIFQIGYRLLTDGFVGFNADRPNGRKATQMAQGGICYVAFHGQISEFRQAV